MSGCVKTALAHSMYASCDCHYHNSSASGNKCVDDRQMFAEVGPKHKTPALDFQLLLCPVPYLPPMCPYCRTPSPRASAALAPLRVSMDTKLTFIMFLPTVVFRKDLINAGAPSRTEQNLSDKVWLQVCDPSREGSPAHSAGRPPEAACDKHHKLLIMDFQRAGSEL